MRRERSFLFQAKVWKLDLADGVAVSSISSCVDGGSVVLGVLGGSVVSVAASGRLRIFNPLTGTQTEAVLEPAAGPLNPAVCVLLQKRQKVLLVSEGGFLHQVQNFLFLCSYRNSTEDLFKKESLSPDQ